MKQVMDKVGEMNFDNGEASIDEGEPEAHLNYGLDLIQRVTTLFHNNKQPVRTKTGVVAQLYGVHVESVKRNIEVNTVFGQVSIEELEGFLTPWDSSRSYYPGWLVESEFKELVSRHEKELLSMGGVEIEDETPMNVS